MHYREFHSYQAFSDAVCDRVIAQVTAHTDTGPYAVALSGGNTPRPIYERLATVLPPAPETLYLMQVDERLVPHDYPDSNFSHIDPLRRHLQMPRSRFIQVNPDLAPLDAAIRYGTQVSQFFTKGGSLTLSLLGLGSDGHTASLFDRPALTAASNAWAVAAHHGGFDRVSLGLRALELAQETCVLVTGSGKAAIIERTLNHPDQTVAGTVATYLKNVELWYSPETETPEAED